MFFVSGVVARSDSPLELGKKAQKDWTGFVDKPYSGSGTHQIVYNVCDARHVTSFSSLCIILNSLPFFLVLHSSFSIFSSFSALDLGLGLSQHSLARSMLGYSQK